MTRTHTVYPPEFPEAWASNWGEDEYGVFMGFTYKGVQQNFRWIEPGEFMMGSPSYEAERVSDETQHRVKLTQGFWLADTNVTQALSQLRSSQARSRPAATRRQHGDGGFFAAMACIRG